MTSVKRIINSGHEFVMNITGGGSEIIPRILAGGGASKAILEMNVPYAAKASNNIAGFVPAHYVSQEYAVGLAKAAYIKATQLSTTKLPKVGVGITAKLFSEGERPGREHLVSMALVAEKNFYTCTFKPPYLDRRLQEAWIADIMIIDIADFVNSAMGFYYNLVDLDKLYRHGHAGARFFGKTDEGVSKLVLSGSFNPLHDGHLEMARVAYEKFNTPVTLELCINNTDKPTIGPLELVRRLEALKRGILGNPAINGVVVTNQKFFIDKYFLLHQPRFLVGSDTMNRIIEHSSAKHLEQIGVKFLLYKRKNKEYIEGYNPSLVEILDAYEDTGISSTQIREKMST